MVVNRRPSVLTILTGVAMSCGFAIALVYEATEERIASNRTELLEEAVARVLSGAIRLQGYELGDELAPASVDQASFVAGYDSAGRFIGVAVPASIMGYQDTISMLFGYSPEQQRLTGFAVLQSRETPGLGSKIGTDPAFLASLNDLDVTLEDAKLETKVVLAGPCTDGAFGIVVFEADSEEDAAVYMNGDPAVEGGLMSAELHPFRISLMQGRD